MRIIFGLDLALNVLENAMCRVQSTTETSDGVVHQLKRWDMPGVFQLGETNDRCWLGVDVGSYPNSALLVDTLADEPSLLGRLHARIEPERTALQVRQRFDPKELSVASAARLLEETCLEADRLRRRMLGENDLPDDEPWEASQAGDAEGAGAFSNLVAPIVDEWHRILRHGGHATWLGLMQGGECSLLRRMRMDTVLSASRSGWHQVGEAAWPVPDEADVQGLASAIAKQPVPDSIAVREAEGRVFAVGAVGPVTFAVEDDSSWERAVAVVLHKASRPSFLDQFASYLFLANKVGMAAPRPDKWQRPLSVTASRGRVSIRVRDREERGMRLDSELSDAATAMFREPEDRGLRGRFNSMLEARFDSIRYHGEPA